MTRQTVHVRLVVMPAGNTLTVTKVRTQSLDIHNISINQSQI